MIKEDLSNEDYHGDLSSYSSSALKLYLKDPVEFHKQYVLGEKPEIPPGLQAAFDFGSYIHTLILEPHKLDEEYELMEGDGLKERERLSGTGKIVVSASQQKQAEKMIASYNDAKFHPNDKKVKTFFQRGKAEESMFAEIDGLPVKVRCDYRKETVKFASINDVKTTSKKVNPSEIRKICDQLDYDLSAALYCDVVEMVTGRKHDFFFLFLGKKDYEVCVVRASEAFLKRGREKYMKAIRGIKKSLKTGVWIAEV